MSSNLASKALLTLFFLLSLFVTCPAEELLPFKGEVNSDNINVRVDSTVSSAVICVLNKGERVEVTLELYDWYKIRLPKAAPAYIKKNMAACLSYTTQKYCESAKVIKNSVNIRLSPNESSPIIGKAVKDEIINIQQEKGGWYKIYPIINSYGWIHKKFINKVNPINLTQ